jgi:hypothetical protein
VKIYGQGFLLTPDERNQLIAKDPQNATCIFPYIGGEEVNTSPTQDFHRYVISFGEMTLEEAGRWPILLNIVREKVKPERDQNNREGYRRYWWQFGEKRPGLNEAIAPLERCLVAAQVTKHLVFSFQPTNRVLSQKLFVFPLPAYTSFALLQSRVHQAWAWLLSSTMKNDLNYSATDCFENFPFPRPEPQVVIPELESIGEALYEARARFMRDSSQGLTDTYNLLRDSKCDDKRTVELRRLHEGMDRAVLAAYGWADIEVPPYTTPATDADRDALERFEDEVIDRLFVLNATRSEAERIGGATTRKARKKRPQATTDTAAQLDFLEADRG